MPVANVLEDKALNVLLLMSAASILNFNRFIYVQFVNKITLFFKFKEEITLIRAKCMNDTC